LLALLRTLWRLCYREVHDWLVAWPALALACRLPLDPAGRGLTIAVRLLQLRPRVILRLILQPQLLMPPGQAPSGGDDSPDCGNQPVRHLGTALPVAWEASG
jgi:hypothetical protein